LRHRRRELSYEALIAAGRSSWRPGDRLRVYRTQTGGAGLVDRDRGGAPGGEGGGDPRDYDVEHYLRVLRETFAARLARALAPADFAAVFADPDQPSLFDPLIAAMRPILMPTSAATALATLGAGGDAAAASAASRHGAPDPP
jgi:hypothetical protein